MIPFRSRKSAEVQRLERTDPATGIIFDSVSELRRWYELQTLAKVGKITGLRRQVVFALFGARRYADHLAGDHVEEIAIKIRSPRYKTGRSCIWTADFGYSENGAVVYEEHKGAWTEAARLRIAIAEACYGITVRITGTAKMAPQRRRRTSLLPADGSSAVRS